MGTDPRAVAQHLRGRFPADPSDPSDGELLRAFAATRGEADFATLLARHGPMVLGVCRRLLGNAADADDAFQAVFLVLARRAAGLGEARSLSGWLYGTAVRVAMKARTAEARRRAREQRAVLMRPTDSTDPPDWDDLRAVLDEELDRLGARYRDPVVLCLLEGRSREEAARLLGWPEGTVNGRLARAKELLRARLARRGVVCSAAALGALVSARGATAVPPELARATLAAVAGTAPAAVAALAAGAGRGWQNWRMTAALAGLAVTGGLLAFAVRPPPEPNLPRVPDPAPDRPAGPAPLRLAHGSEVLAVGVSPDGRVATAGPGAEVRVWKPDGTAAARCAFPGGGAAVAFAPGGKVLAAAGYDGTVRVWEAATGALRHTLAGHGESAQAVAFSPDGALLATAGEDGVVRLWDPATGRPVRDLDGHRGRVWGVCFSPDGRELASAGGDQTVRVWNPTDGTELRKFGGLRGGAYAVEFHPAGPLLAVAADNTVLLLDARTGRETGRVGTARTAVTWFAFSPDGRSLAYRDGRAVRLWEVAAGADRLTVDLPAEPAAVAFTPDGRALVVASGDGAEIWDLRKQVRPLPGADPNALWAHLTGADAGLACRAVEALAAAPAKAVPLVREKLHAVADFRARLGALVRQLGDDEFAARERASRELEAIGPDAGPALRTALADDPSPEVRHRADRLLRRFPAAAARPTPTEARAVEVLEKAATPEARAALAALAAREHDSPLKREAAAALARLRTTKP
jgi:RNA polymerase sigma factor (sigma-70 family)